MANPPFKQDVTDPADNAIVAQFPANERSFRDNVNSYLNVEHDINTGYHQFQLLTTTQKTALTTPPPGMLVYDTTLGTCQINTGTSAAPVWSNVGGDSPGVIKLWTADTAPSGYLVCDGTAYSRTTYANLFDAIGTTFGAGDGSTTFNVPDLRGRTTFGYDPNNTTGRLNSAVTGSFSASAIGNTGGEQYHTLNATESAVLSYSASSVDSGHTHSYQVDYLTAGNGSGGNPQPTQSDTSTGVGYAAISTTVSSNAGGGGHNNIPNGIILNFIIKY